MFGCVGYGMSLGCCRGRCQQCAEDRYAWGGQARQGYRMQYAAEELAMPLWMMSAYLKI